MCAGVVTASGSAASTTQRSHARRSTSAFVPECLQLCALIGQLGAEFRYLRLQVVNVLVENGSTQAGRKRRRRRRLSPFIGWIIMRRTIIIMWNQKSVPGNLLGLFITSLNNGLI